jgi:hypothetical protein
VSDTSPKTDSRERISLRKPAAGGPSGGFKPEDVAAPSTIQYARVALLVAAVGMIARGLLLLGSSATLQKYLVNANNKAGSKKKTPYGPVQIAHDLHALRQTTLLTAVVVAVALVLLAFAFGKARTASGSRWAMLVVLLFTSMPFYIVPISKFPAPANVAGVIVGIASIAAVILVFFLPASQKYFRDCREAATPPELRGQPRPSLFGPRRPRPEPAAAGNGRPTGRATEPARTRSAAPESKPASGAPKARAKVRADAEAVARGAELARARAKASKSRRTAD